ncbi:CoA pyrophosphatase [Aliiroseovarius sp. KMU-50]|uniref:CoA pyrophosphatase n=1 Tax=Aliiroseovarius salicola TaxID=3009082 RepID=A0ABT4VZK1_9RHOB|nr:CoA pyrophosphatase [Aliiroseovarius sp. KMU-50]MDA5092958.1 CoA pyrophosphatase [Aliiroseovarius sp. KMU-50]
MERRKVTPEIEHIRNALFPHGEGSSDFDLNPDIELPVGRKLRPAAVLVPLIYLEDRLHLILTKRASHLKHHPGQIAFPGGKVDDGDRDFEAAALREAWEEIGLPKDAVQFLGQLPPHETVTSYSVTPILGLVTQHFTPIPEQGEVEEVFTVPFAHVSDPAKFSQQGRIWQGRLRHYETVPYGPYYIWGATARMLRALAERVSA